MPSEPLPSLQPDTQRILAALWAEVLQLESPPLASDDFFALGGSSMEMITLEFRIQEEMPVYLPPGAVLRAPTFLELSLLVDSLMNPRSDEAGNLLPRT